jgi:hypothetical protein
MDGLARVPGPGSRKIVWKPLGLSGVRTITTSHRHVNDRVKSQRSVMLPKRRLPYPVFSCLGPVRSGPGRSGAVVKGSTTESDPIDTSAFKEAPTAADEEAITPSRVGWSGGCRLFMPTMAPGAAEEKDGAHNLHQSGEQCDHDADPATVLVRRDSRDVVRSRGQ